MLVHERAPGRSWLEFYLALALMSVASRFRHELFQAIEPRPKSRDTGKKPQPKEPAGVAVLPTPAHEQ